MTLIRDSESSYSKSVHLNESPSRLIYSESQNVTLHQDIQLNSEIDLISRRLKVIILSLKLILYKNNDEVKGLNQTTDGSLNDLQNQSESGKVRVSISIEFTSLDCMESS
ncbi:hypothetical protein MA16_Dca018490 [Dendrobium catenatum]|uniref:Uncharacterized protein n=1 Tax=Dendrobium catenatum TaxID=906689 RepID=A0A2I0W897_9ASPA|nr:hypothetical protein MA16_Dca018490 [Dendrobium catenatum]